MGTSAIPNNDHILTAREAAAYLKVSPVTIYRLAPKGRIPCRKVGGQYRFTRTALDTWLAGDTLSPEAPLHVMPAAAER